MIVSSIHDSNLLTQYAKKFVIRVIFHWNVTQNQTNNVNHMYASFKYQVLEN